MFKVGDDVAVKAFGDLLEYRITGNHIDVPYRFTKGMSKFSDKHAVITKKKLGWFGFHYKLKFSSMVLTESATRYKFSKEMLIAINIIDRKRFMENHEGAFNNALL